MSTGSRDTGLLFLSTLSLRRATQKPQPPWIDSYISIHALLAESDLELLGKLIKLEKFLSTLSLRRATILAAASCARFRFLSTLSLRRATFLDLLKRFLTRISIHALLAESDCWCWAPGTVTARFLSTLSLRRAAALPRLRIPPLAISIHALLAESDRLSTAQKRWLSNFYPRSPCGERLDADFSTVSSAVFLSTLSLRRATHSNMHISLVF